MGELTRIYSCGKSMTTNQLIDSCIDTMAADVEIWFPELNDGGTPLTEYEILTKCPDLIGKTFVTVSEIPILFFMRAIRKEQLRTDEVELWSGDRRIELCNRGDLIDHWDIGGFFELGFNLRFS